MGRIRKYQASKKVKYKKELKRFDLILKEIISRAASKIIRLATGRKVEGKVKIFPAEIRLVKSFYPRENLRHLNLERLN